MLEAVKVRVLWCPCGARLEAANDRTLRVLFRRHLAWEHPNETTQADEQTKQTASSAIYGYAYVPSTEDLGSPGTP